MGKDLGKGFSTYIGNDFGMVKAKILTCSGRVWDGFGEWFDQVWGKDSGEGLGKGFGSVQAKIFARVWTKVWQGLKRVWFRQGSGKLR